MPPRKYREPKPSFPFGNVITLSLAFGLIGGFIAAIFFRTWFHQPFIVSAAASFAMITAFVIWWGLRDYAVQVAHWRGRMKFRPLPRKPLVRRKLFGWLFTIGVLAAYLVPSIICALL